MKKVWLMFRLFAMLVSVMTVSSALAQEAAGTTSASPTTATSVAAAAAAATQNAAAKASASGASLELMAAGSKAGYPTFAGDVDIDYLRIIAARNTEAIEMSKVLLKHSSEADVRMLAGDVIKARDIETRAIKAWMAKHGPKDVTAPVLMPVANAVEASGIPELPSAKIISAVEVVPATPVVTSVPVAVVVPAVVSVTAPTHMHAVMPVVTVSVSVPVSASGIVISSSLPAAIVPGTVYGIPAPSEHIVNAIPVMEMLDSMAAPVKAASPSVATSPTL